MSAMDLNARGLAAQAAALNPQSFTQLCNSNLPSSIQRIDSTGHDRPAHGAATYVCDNQATAELMTRFPTAVFCTRQGRFFRLLPSQDGMITPEQLGCPPSQKGVDQRAWIQMAIDYAHAMRTHGVRGVAFQQNRYEIWVPLRDPSMNQGTPWITAAGTSVPHTDPRVYSGFPLIVRKRVALRAASGGTTFARRKYDGSDPAIWAGTQQLDPHPTRGGGYYWRGGMFFLMGLTFAQGNAVLASEGYDGLAAIDFEGKWILDGGIPQSGFGGQYVPTGESYPYASGKLRPEDGAGWDWSDKPIWASQQGWCGDINFDNLEIGGFRGELIYQAGNNHGSIRGNRLHLHDTDADAINPHPHLCGDGKPGRLEINHLILANAFQAMEGGFGDGASKIDLLEIDNCLQGGSLAATRYVSNPAGFTARPSFTIGRIRVRNAAYAVTHLTNIGEIVATDSPVSLGAVGGNFWSSVVGRIVMVHENKSSQVYFAPTLSLDATSPQDSWVGEIIHQRSPLARANGAGTGDAFQWAGSTYGPNIRIGSVSGDYMRAPRNTGGASTGFSPVMQEIKGTGVPSGPYNIETTPVMTDIPAWYLRLAVTNTASGGNFPFTLPAGSSRFPAGARLRLVHYISNVVFSLSTSNTRMGKRMLMLPNVQYDFISDGTLWIADTPGATLSGSVTAVLQKGGAPIPAGDVSDEVTLTIAGVRPGMEVRVTPMASLASDAQLMARVSADNTVAVRARNLNLAAPLTMTSSALRVTAEWAS